MNEARVHGIALETFWTSAREFSLIRCGLMPMTGPGPFGFGSGGGSLTAGRAGSSVGVDGAGGGCLRSSSGSFFVGDRLLTRSHCFPDPAGLVNTVEQSIGPHHLSRSDYCETTICFCLRSAASVWSSRFRCALTSPGGVSAIH
jgi:hypothetical protein